MGRFNIRAGAAGLVALGWVATGCGDSTSPDNSPLSQEEVQIIGEDVSDHLEGMSSEFTWGGFLTPNFPSPGPRTVWGPPRFPTHNPNCPTVTPFPPVDTDGDHVPDDVTLSFTLPDCSFTQGRIVFEITGTVQITDPTTTGFGQRIVFTDLQHKLTVPSGRFFLRRLDGVRQHLVTDILSLTDSTTSEVEWAGRPKTSLTNAWQVTFTPDPGETFDNDRHLPSGTFVASGSTDFNFGDRTRSLSVTTVSPVHFDATCNSRPPFTSGELLITVLKGDQSDTIHVVFNGCGVDPTVTHEETPTT